MSQILALTSYYLQMTGRISPVPADLQRDQDSASATHEFDSIDELKDACRTYTRIYDFIKIITTLMILVFATIQGIGIADNPYWAFYTVTIAVLHQLQNTAQIKAKTARRLYYEAVYRSTSPTTEPIDHP